MKKLLSVVLILAALFGLVAGFMDFSDALNCKAVWEQKGQESDENLAKLSDGLTTLKDNEKAYTEGLATVAAGEESLAAGKKTYEEGLATYNAGIEEFNTKTDAYNAALQQLKGGRATLLEAKDKLSVYTKEQKTAAKNAMGDPGDADAKTAYAAMNNKLDGSTDAAAIQKQAVALVAGSKGVSSSDIESAVSAYTTAYTAWVKGGKVGAEPTTGKEAAVAVKGLADGYQAGLLDKGMKAYDAGYIEYMGLKGTLAFMGEKLAAAETQLAAAKEQLDAGEKTIKEGEAQLAEGKAALKVYEDGVAQVKDGLKQVMATKPDAGLMSIADRLGAGFSYMDGDKLNIDKGFQVVDAANEYSAENGALVTKEIASRLIGAVLVLIAGALAAIAGVIGLIKSGKISGLLSIVSVAAVIIGVALSYLAGSELSKLAGSEGSMLMYIAGGILAVAGLVYGIVSMAAKKTEEVKTA